MKTKKQAIPTPSLSRQGMIHQLLCMLTFAIAALISLPSFAETAYVGSYEDLKAAIANASVDVIIVTANINVPCETSKSLSDGADETGVSTAQLIINRSLTLQSQPGSKYVIKRVAADGANASALKSLIAIRGNGPGNNGTDNLTQNSVEVSLTNIIIDGGADWGSSEVSARRSADKTAYSCSGRSMIDVYLGGILNLEDGVEIRNGFTTKSDNSLLNDTGGTSQCFGGAVRVDYHNETGGGTVNIKAGAVIHDCSTKGGYGGALGAYNYARLNLYGGMIYNCSARNGGAIACTYRSSNGYSGTTAGTIRMYGGTIRDCCAEYGGAFLMHGENVDDYILGGSITSCNATNGGAMSIGYSNVDAPRVHMVAKSSGWLTISGCSNTTASPTENTGGYSYIHLNIGSISETPVYQVTFQNNNTDFAILHVLQGNSLDEAFPAAPVNANFRFVGWYNGETQVTSSTAISGNMTVTAKWDFLGSGTADTPYLIPSADVWNFLADKVAAGNNYSDIYFRQTANISVTTMIGAPSPHEFKGTYDGYGHTLTVTYNTTEEATGPFRYARGATIMNLHTAGTITTSGKFAGGLIGFAYNANTITNCRSSVFISSSVSGDGTHGGFIGDNESTVSVTTSFEGCVFDGKLLGSSTDCCGGFVGWCSGNVRLSLLNCLYAPQQVTISTSGSQTFSRTGSELLNNLFSSNTNSFYSEPLGGAQGKQARTISAGDDVTISGLGDGTEYNVSGITSYGTGIKYGGKLYAGDGDAVSLTLSHVDAPDGHTFGGYTASSGTLSGSDNPYSLTMPASDVTITAVWTPITVTLFATGTTNEWMTWCGEDEYTVPEGCVAYEVTGVSNGAVTLSDALTPIPAYTPVLIHRTAGELTSDIVAAWEADGTAPTSGYNSTTGIVTAEIAANSITFYGNAGNATQTHNPYATGPDPDNADETIPIDDHIPALTKATGLADGWACYILRDGNFIFVDTDRGIAANRCVLAVKTSSLGGNAGARVLTIGTETTGISLMEDGRSKMEDGWYSLDGLKLEGKPTKKGLYIRGKKKVVIK